MDYSKCCIYKIEHVDDRSLVYVGHTTSFDKRKTKHKSSCYNENGKQHNYKLYQMIRDNGGWEMFNMIEVEKYPCNNKREAERRENEVMKELKANMNTYSSFRTEEEKKLYMEEYNKNYYEVHKEKIQERVKEYYEENKPKIQKKEKEYREANKEKIQEYKKEYHELNKANINANVKCKCVFLVTKQHLNRHQSTKKTS